MSDYDCEEWGDEDDDWDWGDEDNDWDWDNEGDWSDVEWVVSDWEDFDWDDIWNDLDLSNVVDWNDIPWDDIIDFDISPEEFVDYIFEIIIPEGQSFNWSSFIEYINSFELIIDHSLSQSRSLLKTINILGQQARSFSGDYILINIYSDGFVEKIYLIK